jgi:hypothetical protein
MNSSSPLVTAASHRDHEPHPSMKDLHCTWIVRDGEFTENATDAHRRIYADRMPDYPRPKPEVPLPPKRKAGPGRPPACKRLLPKIERLRAEGLTWVEIGNRLKVKPDTIRAALKRSRKKGEA